MPAAVRILSLCCTPKQKTGEKMQQQARYNFSNSFPHLLSDPLRNLESDVALALLPEQTVTSSFSNEERQND